MDRQVTLRPRVAADQPFLRRLFEDCRLLQYGSLTLDRAQREALIGMQFRAMEAHYESAFPGAACQIVVRNDEPIGSMRVWRSQTEMRLVDIGLLARYRGHGIGSELLGTLIQESGEHRLSLTLQVEHGNPALRLYQRLGFLPIGVTAITLEMSRSPSSCSDGG